MGKTVSIRILQLKNNFYWDAEKMEEKTPRKPLGAYCVLGYFDAFDITEERKVSTTTFNTWGYLGNLTSQMDDNANCRMLVCVTEQQEKDKKFWEEQNAPLFFVTMIRVDRAEISSGKLNDLMRELDNNSNQISYLSYDYSEIIVVTKTNKYSTGIRLVNELRKRSGVVKTYTVFAVLEKYLKSYELLEKTLTEERVSCRLHCMVKDDNEAETFIEALKGKLFEKNEGEVKICKFETLGGYDWVIEIDDVSIYSILERYNIEDLLAHTNREYNRAFYNIESEILVDIGADND